MPLVMINGLKEALDILESEIALVQTAYLRGVRKHALVDSCFFPRGVFKHELSSHSSCHVSRSYTSLVIEWLIFFLLCESQLN